VLSVAPQGYATRQTEIDVFSAKVLGIVEHAVLRAGMGSDKEQIGMR
jgi:hypothetical protein